MPADKEFIYLYGIIREPRFRKFDIIGIDQGEVYTINEGELSLVASNTLNDEIDPTRKNMKLHAAVQEKLLDEYTLLPMGFGMLVENRDEAIKLLKSNYKAFLEEIEHLKDKIEFALKVYWNPDAVRKELEEKSSELSKIKNNIQKSSLDVEKQSLLIEAGMLVEKLVERWKDDCINKVYSTLKKTAVSSKLDDGTGFKNILNASFLVEKTRGEEFIDQLYKLDAEFAGRLDFKCIGPLPPYNFVGVSLG